MNIKKLITGFCFFCATISLSAQTLYTKMGQIPDLEWIETADQEESAKVMEEEVVTHFAYVNYIFRYETQHLVRMKIFNKEGFKYASIAIPYHGAKKFQPEKIIDIEGVTFQWNGDKTTSYKLKKKDIQRVVISDSLMEVRFTLPNVKEEAIIEYKYTLISYQLQNLRDWKVQRDIPVKHSTYRTIFPDFFWYNISKIGGEHIKITDRSTVQSFGVMTGAIHSDNSSEMDMEANDLPAFKAEKQLLYAPKEYATKIRFRLDWIKIKKQPMISFITNWHQIDSTLSLDKNFGAIYSGFSPNGEIAKENPKPLLKSLLKKIRSNYKWNGEYALFAKKSSKRKANSATINLQLIKLLRQTGFNAFPIVLRTRDAGLLEIKTANISDLNHVIAGVNINGDLFILDATSEYSDINILPPNLLTETARLIDIKKGTWLDLSAFSAAEIQNIAYTIKEDGSAKGTITSRHTGGDIFLLRSNYDQKSLYSICKRNKKIKISHAKKMIEKKDYIQESFDFKTMLTKNDNEIKFKPFIIPILPKDNINSERTAPVEFPYSKQYKQTLLIILPKGYEIDNMPNPVILKSDIAELRGQFIVELNENQLQMTLIINIKKPYFKTDEIKELKEFIDKVNTISSIELNLIKGNN